MAACCQGGVCTMPPPTPSSTSSSSSSALSAGPRIGIPHAFDSNPDDFQFLDAHAENIVHFDGAAPESVTLRVQQLNGHTAAKVIALLDPIAQLSSSSAFSSGKRLRSWNRVLAVHGVYADDKQRVEPLHLQSVQQMNPPVAQGLVDGQVRDSLSPQVIRHRWAHILRGGVDQSGLFDLVYEARWNANWATKLYGIGHFNQKSATQLVGGVNVRFDGPRTSCTVKYSTDGQALGGSFTQALGRAAETVVGAEGFWVHEKQDYTFGCGLRRRWSTERFRRPFVLSTWFQNYGIVNAAVSAPLSESVQMATNLNYEVASQQSNLQIATQYTPTPQTLAAVGLPDNVSASLHAKFDYERGVSAALRLNSRVTKYGVFNASAGISSGIKKNSLQTPTSIAFGFELY